MKTFLAIFFCCILFMVKNKAGSNHLRTFNFLRSDLKIFSFKKMLEPLHICLEWCPLVINCFKSLGKNHRKVLFRSLLVYEKVSDSDTFGLEGITVMPVCWGWYRSVSWSITLWEMVTRWVSANVKSGPSSPPCRCKLCRSEVVLCWTWTSPGPISFWDLITFEAAIVVWFCCYS